MILQYNVSNFKSIGEKITIDFEHNNKILPFVLINGTNHSGKTNIFESMKCLNRLIAGYGTYEPLMHLIDTEFHVIFTYNEKTYEYELKFKNKCISYEVLRLKEDILFERIDRKMISNNGNYKPTQSLDINTIDFTPFLCLINDYIQYFFDVNFFDSENAPDLCLYDESETQMCELLKLCGFDFGVEYVNSGNMLQFMQYADLIMHSFETFNVIDLNFSFDIELIKVLILLIKANKTSHFVLLGCNYSQLFDVLKPQEIYLTEKINNKTTLFRLCDFGGVDNLTPLKRWYDAGKFGGKLDIQMLDNFISELFL